MVWLKWTMLSHLAERAPRRAFTFPRVMRPAACDLDHGYMASSMEDFLSRLGSDRDPLLANASGTIRLDVRDNGRTEHWRITVAEGAVTVGRGSGKADGVIRADREVFDQVVSGHVNAMAAVLRGALDVEGNPELLVQLQRWIPGAPRPHRSVRRKVSEL